MDNDKPIVQRYRSSSAVSVVTDLTTTSPQHKVSLTKGIWNPEMVKGTNPQHGYYLDTTHLEKIHTHKPISPSRRVVSSSARSVEKFKALTNYILTSNQLQNNINHLQVDTEVTHSTRRMVKRPLVIDLGVPVEKREKPSFSSSTEALIASGFRPDKLVSALANRKDDFQASQSSEVMTVSSQKVQSSVTQTHGVNYTQQSRVERTVTRGKSPMARPYAHQARHSNLRKKNEQKPLGPIQQQRITFQFPSLLEIIPLFPASTILYFVTEEPQSAFSDSLQRVSALRNVTYLRLYDVLPIRNCPGVEHCTDYLSVQSKSTNAYIPISPWTSSIQVQHRSSMHGKYTGSPSRKLSPHLSKLTDDITMNIQKSSAKQTAALVAATKIIDGLTTASVTSGTLPECLISLINTCLLAIQEDNLLCDPTESAENLKMDADVSIRTVATMISKNLIGTIKQLLTESMSYTCGKTVIEQQVLGNQRKEVHGSTNSALTRYLSPAYTILNRLQSLANLSMEPTTELLELTVASKRPRTFAFLVHTASILCLVGPGIKDAFFTGQFMGQLADFTGRLLVDKLTFAHVNTSSMLHVSLAVMCRLNYSFGFVLLPYTTQALNAVLVDLVKVSSTIIIKPSGLRSDHDRGYPGNLSQGGKKAYHKVTRDNTVAIHAISKFSPQTDEERSVQTEYLEELKAQGITQQSSGLQSLTVHSLASLLYLHASAIHATLAFVTSPTSSGTHRAVASKALQYTIDISGRILQWISSVPLDTLKVLCGKGPSLLPSIIYELHTLLLPNLYIEDWTLGLSRFELQFSNLEQLTNHFLARLLNQTRRALLITDQDVHTITVGLIRDPDAIYLLSDILNKPQVSEPPHASAVTTCGESEMGVDGIRELDDISPGVYLAGSQDNQLFRETFNRDCTYNLEDRDNEKLADYFEDDSGDMPIDEGFI
ncbi:Hypothetical protein GLP15_1552 [Giardia lamblia P15]|uniref:Uncharacterized protein n=1 Tax=Giardia intestinalis (strain P15) TaxID=658858 RepID=E1EXJ6_GIAIA|nr:Hypothetical protein GLP15_1552 [Giardia lamblia P15]